MLNYFSYISTLLILNFRVLEDKMGLNEMVGRFMFLYISLRVAKLFFHLFRTFSKEILIIEFLICVYLRYICETNH